MLRLLKTRFVRKSRRYWYQWRNRITGDKKYFHRPFAGEDPNLIVVVGAESTATRFLTEVLSVHPAIVAEARSGSHDDKLDEVWRAIGQHNVVVRQKFPDRKDGVKYVTRRSIPHASSSNERAEFLEFPPLEEFLKEAIAAGFFPIVLVTVRSPVPNLMSWKENRASSKGSVGKAVRQYQEVYPFIFDAVRRARCPYYILPNEAISSDGEAFLESIFYLLGLESPQSLPAIRRDVNHRYYQAFRLARKN